MAGVLIGLVVLTLVLVLLNAVAFGSYDTEVQSQTQTMSLVPNLTERGGLPMTFLTLPPQDRSPSGSPS